MIWIPRVVLLLVVVYVALECALLGRHLFWGPGPFHVSGDLADQLCFATVFVVVGGCVLVVRDWVVRGVGALLIALSIFIIVSAVYLYESGTLMQYEEWLQTTKQETTDP